MGSCISCCIELISQSKNSVVSIRMKRYIETINRDHETTETMQIFELFCPLFLFTHFQSSLFGHCATSFVRQNRRKCKDATAYT